MDDKRTMTLNLTAREMRTLEALAAKKEMTKTALLRHALRLYETLDARISEGERIVIENQRAKSKSELLVL